MNTMLKNFLLFLLAAIIIVITAGVYHFNMTDDDIYIETESGGIVPVDEYEEGSETTESETPQVDEPILSQQATNELVGTWTWTATTINAETEEATATQPTSDAFTITFGAHGSINGTTDCNNYFGLYKQSTGNELLFGPFGSTKMYCEGSQENDFHDLIGYVRSYFISDRGELVMAMMADGGALIFEKVSSVNKEAEKKVAREEGVIQPYDTSENGDLRLPFSVVEDEPVVIITSGYEDNLDCSYVTYDKKGSYGGVIPKNEACKGFSSWTDYLNPIHTIKLTEDLYLLNFVSSNEVFINSKPSVWKKVGDEIVFEEYIYNGQGFGQINNFYLTDDLIILFDSSIAEDGPRHSESAVRAQEYNFITKDMNLLYEHRGSEYNGELVSYDYKINDHTVSVIIRKIVCKNELFDCHYFEDMETIDYDLGEGQLISRY